MARQSVFGCCSILTVPAGPSVPLVFPLLIVVLTDIPTQKDAARIADGREAI